MTGLRVLLAATTLVAACGGDESEGFPIMPSGGGGGSSSRPDAAVDGGDGDANMTIAGRVCLINDVRAPATCASTGADGFTVNLGTAQATTAANGAFTLTRPTGSNLVWRVSGGTTIVPSALEYAISTSSPSIPAIDRVLYEEMLASTGAAVATGAGAVIVRAARNDTPVAGLAAASSPASVVYYDGATPTDWELDITGTNGIAWIPTLPEGTASVTFDDGSATSTATDIPVFADTVTFRFHDVP